MANSKQKAVGTLLLAASLAFLPACVAPTIETPREWASPEIVGRLPAEVKEASGLAVSRRSPRIFWTHSDSGGEPVLYAIGADGALRGKMRIAGVRNVDWEDIASFTLDGRDWLLIADVGDNAARRRDCALLVVEEPPEKKLRSSAEWIAEVAWKISVSYPEGPLDCESVAVDSRGEKVYLLAKRVTPHGLYELPLRPVAKGVAAPLAKRVGELPAFPPAPEPLRLKLIPTGKFRAQPTGMDFAPDGTAAVVLTYGEVLVYPKKHDETWPAALMRPPIILAPHGLWQAEAVAFGTKGDAILVTGEGTRVPILRYPACH